MSIAAPPTASFAPLPRPLTTDGQDRRVGVEIEFAGLTEAEVARLAMVGLGGRIAAEDAHAVTVENTAIGTIEIELDTALKAWGGNRLVDAGLDAARALVPVEIVTEPLDWPGLERLDAFRDTLREAGALGTHDGALLGFGVHFNITVTGVDDAFTARTILAFGLIEHWLRRAMPIDATRRVMPFVDTWPAAFVDTLAQSAPAPAMPAIRRAYARHCNSRNFALDLLPLFKLAEGRAFADRFPGQDNTKARPAFHYRLPDSRIDEADWSLAREWRRWHVVEALADEPALLTKLAHDYLDRDAPFFGEREAWADHVGDRLAAAGLA